MKSWLYFIFSVFFPNLHPVNCRSQRTSGDQIAKPPPAAGSHPVAGHWPEIKFQRMPGTQIARRSPTAVRRPVIKFRRMEFLIRMFRRMGFLVRMFRPPADVQRFERRTFARILSNHRTFAIILSPADVSPDDCRGGPAIWLPDVRQLRLSTECPAF